MADSQDDRTEKATPKKLKDAKEEGQVARSRDLNLAVSTLTATGMLVWTGPAAVDRLTSTLTEALTRVGRSGADLHPEDLTSLVLTSGAVIGLVVGPIAIAAALAGVGMAAAQGGLHFAPQALRFDISRLSPARGLQRLAPSQSWVDLLKTIATVAVLGAIALQIGKALALDGMRFSWMSTVGAAGYGWASARRLLWQAGFALLVIGVLDYGLQRWRLLTSLKMTKQETRDEGKSSEGSPEIKGRVRKVQRDMARRRMLQAAAHATVVVTNPTHYAVALEYRREKSPAPVVVAKGRDLLAQRIREIARKNGVPIIENKALARALHESVEVGETIPSALFGAVAEVLGYLIRIKQLML
jgi:flagellar biosynthetic protein FlhB